ncbi:MAG: glycosyltransferase family 4 protein [Patescibacteria group bacterium]|jgi:glycosyltransferase involved in cell wall biosynthesis
MRIAQIAPLAESVPPKKYGGTERVVAALTEGLVLRGHDVTLFASGDSEAKAKLFATYPKHLREAMPKDSVRRTMATLSHLGVAYAHQEEFDIIHDHTGFYGNAFAYSAQTPTLVTMHGAFTKENIELFESLSRAYLVTISHRQRQLAPHLNHIATIYNGLNFDNYPFSDTHEGYLLYVGRISQEKGTRYTVEVARRLNMRLIIAAKLDNPKDRRYFKRYVKPYISDKIQWVGEVTEEERNKLYANALCLLHPVTWPEPFGLTLIEAMACGCPVIAFNQGSIPEIIQDRRTGYIVGNVDEMAARVKLISEISREECKNHARNNFNADRMVEAYESLYSTLLQLLNQQKQHILPHTRMTPQYSGKRKARPTLQ